MLLSSSAAFASHRLIGWVYWDPHGVEEYANLGIPNGFGYYVTTRKRASREAGVDVVTAAYGSIHPDFIRASYEHLEMYATIEDAIRLETKPSCKGWELCSEYLR